MFDPNLLKYYTPEQISSLREHLKNALHVWYLKNQVNNPNKKPLTEFERMLETYSRELVYQYQNSVDAFRRRR